MLYIDQTASAESVTAQLGAIKAGVTVVAFDEKDDIDALDNAIGQSGAKGLIFTPDTATSGENQTRQTFLQKLMPELSGMYRGDELNLAKYPNLKVVAQTGHNAMRGVNKFRDIAVYANPRFSSNQIETNSSDSVTHVAYKGGREVCSITSGDLVAKADSLWSSHLSSAATGEDANASVFMSADLETPFGFAALLGCSTHFKKVFIPGTFNMSQMLKSLPRQNSSILVCDEEFYDLEVPGAKQSEY